MKILRTIKVIGMVFMLGLIFLLVSCGENAKTVIFKDYDGTVLKEELVDHGKSATAPEVPSREGHTFKGWNKTFENVTENMTVYTVWEIKPSGDISIEILGAEFIDDGYIINVNNEQSIISFSDIIRIEPNSSWNLYFDYNTTKEVVSNTVNLIDGDNIFYILVITKDGSSKVYSIVVRRLPMYTVSFDSKGGSYIDSQYIQEKDFVEIPNHPTRVGYTFDRWNFNFDSPVLENITIDALWEPNKYNINYDISDELLEETRQVVTYDNSYELIVPEKEGFIFKGWQYNNMLFTNGIWNLSNDITLTPRWSLENITLIDETYFYDGEVKSLEIDGELPEGVSVNYENNNQIESGTYIVTATFIYDQNNYEYIEPMYANLIIVMLPSPKNISIMNGILSWDAVEGAKSYKVVVNDREYITTNTYYNFSTIETINIFVTSINGNAQSNKAGLIYEENNNAYIYYGKYPQTKVSDSSLISALNSLTETNSEGYYEYGGNEYAKLVATPDSSGYKFSDNTTVVSGTTYYFKVEPIKWRVISNNYGTIQLLSEYILDNQYYHPNRDTRTIDGKTIYPNNYEHSYIREWLNNDFYNKAFGTLDQNAILTTLVDNSASTTYPSSDSYASNNTNDKIYLLSYRDARNSSYGFTYIVSTKYAITTDYARAKGVRMNTGSYYGCGPWWLRSPSGTYSNNAYFVGFDFVLNGNSVDAIRTYNVSHAYNGVRPALQIK